jgi:hypothetical protein
MKCRPDTQRSPRARREPRGLPRRRIPAWRVRAALGVLTLTLASGPFRATAEDVAQRPTSETASEVPDAGAAHAERSKRPRTSGIPWPGGHQGATGRAVFDGGWSGMACLAAVLAACGGIAVAARRLGPRPAAGGVEVVGRVSLSPKHSVYLLRVGQRVLVVGAGPQGPPALITEVENVPQDPPAPHQGAES